ncbi:hypothetical protein [Vibrio harveyi]|uniref:hypothetical protein n=1 Tax=Vibrio harveyi TaxID=669 RepID=UPI003BB672B5
MFLSSVYLTIEKAEGLSSVKRCIKMANLKPVDVKGLEWFLMGDMSAVSVANGKVEVVEHLHDLHNLNMIRD